MEFKKYLPVVVLAAILIGGFFYWFAYRPSKIRQECFKSSRKTLDEIFDKVSSRSDGEVDVDYKNCLRLNGLEK